jgi:hypothetical protein
MVDTSQYSIVESFVARVWVYGRSHITQKMRKLMTNFLRELQNHVPRRANLLAYEKQATAFGSVKDSPRSGRPVGS